ncbi:MAG: hypothetical protein H6841_03560 [Planctomycetes bacterium]|nr:hypothetical protein [Planctomycetota bacterium]MCB9934197.1 hypothetical protein [Planctomycetota bacterium]
MKIKSIKGSVTRYPSSGKPATRKTTPRWKEYNSDTEAAKPKRKRRKAS